MELVEENGPRWLVKSEESSSHDYRFEWMAPLTPIGTPGLPQLAAISSRSSSEFVVVPDIDRPGPSHTARVVISSDSSSEGDPDSPCCLDSPPSRVDQ